MHTLTRIAICSLLAVVLSIQGGCKKKAEEKAASSGAASDTLLSPESKPLEIASLQSPDSLRVTEKEIPEAIVWNYFDQKSHRTFSKAERAVLSRDGFFIEEYPAQTTIVTDDMVDDYQQLYVEGYGQSYSTVPVFLSSDFLLHIFHVVFDRMLQNAEEKRFLPLLDSLTQSLLAATASQMQSQPDLRPVLVRNAAFLGVAARLTHDSASIPPEAEALVAGELALIRRADGFHVSPLMNSQEDYSQYKVRGHYATSESLGRFFQAMMWYGRRSFSLKSDTLSLQAIALCRIMESPENHSIWERIEKPSAFIAGNSDDLTL
ncbi:MAG TPA: DUF3160 domain-containing protein, partial [Bacteroidota bacterium]|nr:DUF3160 domain-containing protein [Bacteroidota bacterium]